ERAIGFYHYTKLVVDVAVPCKVEVFPLEVETQLASWLEEGQRDIRWFELQEASDAVEEPELSAIIRNLAALLAGPSRPGGEFFQLGLAGGIVEGARRPRQAVVIAQGRSCVCRAEQPAALEQRDHLGRKGVELRRQHRRHHVETVRSAVVEPLLHEIG